MSCQTTATCQLQLQSQSSQFFRVLTFANLRGVSKVHVFHELVQQPQKTNFLPDLCFLTVMSLSNGRHDLNCIKKFSLVIDKPIPNDLRLLGITVELCQHTRNVTPTNNSRKQSSNKSSIKGKVPTHSYVKNSTVSDFGKKD